MRISAHNITSRHGDFAPAAAKGIGIEIKGDGGEEIQYVDVQISRHWHTDIGRKNERKEKNRNNIRLGQEEIAGRV